jgi:hypothetical protein
VLEGLIDEDVGLGTVARVPGHHVVKREHVLRVAPWSRVSRGRRI